MQGKPQHGDRLTRYLLEREVGRTFCAPYKEVPKLEGSVANAACTSFCKLKFGKGVRKG